MLRRDPGHLFPERFPPPLVLLAITFAGME